MDNNQNEKSGTPTKNCKTDHTSEKVIRTSIRLGNTTYLVGMHFKEDSGETMNEKMIRMIRDDVRNGNY